MSCSVDGVAVSDQKVSSTAHPNVGGARLGDHLCGQEPGPAGGLAAPAPHLSDQPTEGQPFLPGLQHGQVPAMEEVPDLPVHPFRPRRPRRLRRVAKDLLGATEPGSGEMKV